jgi:hypothetical protein
MSTADLINTGILMGIIHVLTGPDHLSTLATLAGTNINNQSQSRGEAFFLGIQWGLGHSVGLLVVAGLLIAVEEGSGEWIAMDPMLTMIFEGFVGVFMLALGAYGLFKADKNNKEYIVLQSQMPRNAASMLSLPMMADLRSIHDDNKSVGSGGSGIYEYDLDEDEDIAAVMEDVLETDSRYSNHDDLSQCLSSGSYLQGYMESIGGPSDISFVTVPTTMQNTQRRAKKERPSLMSASSLVNKHTSQRDLFDSSDRSGGSGVGIYQGFRLLWRKFFSCSPGILAIVAGVLHGVAGPGGVLGVIPAVQLRDAKLASLYLGTFCLTSTIVMGGFAAFYGTLSEWLAGGGRGHRVFMVEVGSALLSVCVGCVWLVLLALGKLDNVFP